MLKWTWNNLTRAIKEVKVMLKKIILFLVFSFLLCGCTATIHSHKFIDGKCDCGETTPNYVEPHEHVYILYYYS